METKEAATTRIDSRPVLATRRAVTLDFPGVRMDFSAALYK
jgi:hypothetical protein